MIQKKMNRRVLLLFAISIVGALGFIAASLPQHTLSTDQQELINLWGYPDQFAISYIARGSIQELELVRTEI